MAGRRMPQHARMGMARGANERFGIEAAAHRNTSFLACLINRGIQGCAVGPASVRIIRVR